LISLYFAIGFTVGSETLPGPVRRVKTGCTTKHDVIVKVKINQIKIPAPQQETNRKPASKRYNYRKNGVYRKDSKKRKRLW